MEHRKQSQQTVKTYSAMKAFTVLSILLISFGISLPRVFAQVSPEEHKKHHPEKTKSNQSSSNGMMSGKNGGMMGGGMMDEMMKKMGAPKPKDLYPSLMELPDLPLERRGELEQEAHKRMISGTHLIQVGLEELAISAERDDFNAMQIATRKLREGLSNFESGLATYRAIREGKAPRNIALKWFKKELNIDGTIKANHSGAMLWGMTPFHTSVMAILILFTVAMIWMYFFKMKRAALLLEKLSTANEISNSAENHSDSTKNETHTRTNKDKSKNDATLVSHSTTNVESYDCCDISTKPCPSEDPIGESENFSAGLIPVAKKKICRLRVAKIFDETEEVKTIRLVSCHGGRIPFNYLPGQFLTFTLPVGVKPIRRSYTISSSPTQAYYCEVTVKQEEKGEGSQYLCNRLKVGDSIEVKAPSGKFTFSGDESDSVVLIAGGVGITPMMSTTRALTDMCWQGSIYLIIACRDPQHFIFESEIKRLEDHFDNLHVFVAMSRIQKDINGYRAGRIKKDLLAEWVPDVSSKRIHICGAPAMMKSIKSMLFELGALEENVFSENFGSAQKPKAKTAIVQDAHETKTIDAMVTFATSNKSVQLFSDETVLEAAERIDVEIDYSCRVGTCGICVAKLLSGKVTMEIEDGLDPEDKEAGMILTCQAKTSTDVSIEA